jgi:hypothetical protein
VIAGLGILAVFPIVIAGRESVLSEGLAHATAYGVIYGALMSAYQLVVNPTISRRSLFLFWSLMTVAAFVVSVFLGLVI